MFTFPIDPAALFAERAGQFARWGIPSDVVARARTRIDDMWGDGRSGWVPVWSQEAQRAEARQDWLVAALCWGAARFPCSATPARRGAYQRQLTCYRQTDVPVQRRVLDVPYRSATIPVPVHVYDHGRARALLLVCGGVDTWKVELHRLASAAARLPGLAVAAVDMPGTGESGALLDSDVDEILGGVVRLLGTAVGVDSTGILGMSFGGHWAAKLAAIGHVDAAVDIGGPVGAGGAAIDITALPNGMPGIIGNALGLDAPPTPEVLGPSFSLRRHGLLGTSVAPLLVINGTADPYLPIEDTTAFAADPNATVWLVRDAGHCATEHLGVILPAALAWLHDRIAPSPLTAARLNETYAAAAPALVQPDHIDAAQ